MGNNKAREIILNQPSYWVEGINGFLYSAIINYMKENDISKQTDLAKHLGISKGRVSQILNDGDINFSLEKIIEIALKVGVYPDFQFKNKSDFIRSEKEHFQLKNISINIDDLHSFQPKGKGKLININRKVSKSLQFDDLQQAVSVEQMMY